MPIFYLLSIIKSVCVISCTNVCKDMEVQIAFKISNSYVQLYSFRILVKWSVIVLCYHVMFQIYFMYFTQVERKKEEVQLLG